LRYGEIRGTQFHRLAALLSAGWSIPLTGWSVAVGGGRWHSVDMRFTRRRMYARAEARGRGNPAFFLSDIANVET
jgi:hypothetical protein